MWWWLACGPGPDQDSGAPPPPPPALEYTLEVIGAPTWDLIDPVLFRAEIGSDYTDYYPYNEFDAADESLRCLLRGLGHGLDVDLVVITPGTQPHAGPYDTELSDGATGCGYDLTNDQPEFAMEFGTGVFFGGMAVANDTAEIGGSPDASGVPIIWNDQLPIVLAWTLSASAEISGSNSLSYPNMNTLKLPQEGLTHAPIVVFANLEWMPAGTPAAGEWTWTGTFTDRTGAGWTLTMPMHVSAD
jgi:hypothetical protein